MEVLLYVYCRLIDNLKKDFGHNPGKEILGTMETPPQPMDPFGTVSLASFLKPNLPHTARESLTSIMRTNLGNYEKLIRDKMEAGDVTPGTLVVCELDRAFGKKCSPSMTVGMSPCLKTQLKYFLSLAPMTCSCQMQRGLTSDGLFRRNDVLCKEYTRAWRCIFATVTCCTHWGTPAQCH